MPSGSFARLAKVTASTKRNPLMTGGAVDRRLAGSDSVAVVLGQAVYPMIVIAFVAAVVCWIGYARCVLRAAPKAEAEVQPA